MDTLHASLIALQDAFRSTRKLVLDGVGVAASSFKDDESPVTETDTAVEKYIIDLMQTNFPELPILGEEGGYDPENLPETCWLIDPIDGTKSYIKNISAFTGMAVLLQAGEARASIIYDYTADAMYVAEAGKGTYKNGQKIDLREVPLPDKVYCKDIIATQLGQVLEPAGIKTEIAPSGAGFGFAQVIDGVSAGRFHLHAGGHIHDHAPGALLVKEAGGEVIPVLDSRYTYKTRSFVACHPALASFIREQLASIRQIENPAQAVLN